jgi:ubiquinone/menaquinone biosynthesis C-methylase UbiE
VRGVELYQQVAATYSSTRRADPRIAALIEDALGDARSVANVGAGTGSYEPTGREVIAIEPSEAMIGQRPHGAARAICATAEALPLDDDSVDAAMAILSSHHWADPPAGLREMVRVARRRALVLTWDNSQSSRFWLTRDYVPAFACLPTMTIDETAAWLGGAELTPVPLPHDCTDGFYHAYWRRPEAYIDENVRANISVFWKLDPDEVNDGIARLRADLESGRWHERNGDLLDLDEVDYGYRLLVRELG